ncbi:MAG: methionine synthase [Actinobacteria bacterium]|nr:methionine synthase [Actinomycetota bacterium]
MTSVLPPPDRGHPFLDAIHTRVVIVDGAMGTGIQARELTDADYGGEAYEGCPEMLNRTRPDVIEELHRSYLEVGVDAVETNTFGGAPWVLAEYDLEDDTEELNRLAAEIARRACDEHATPDRPKWVVGSIGPGTRSPTLSLGKDPATTKDFIDVDTMEEGYRRQIRGLLEGGADVLLVETSFDLLQIKAAVAAANDVFVERGARVPLMVQFTVEKDINTMLLGTEPLAAIAALDPLAIDVIGMNCATGPEDMREHVRTLSRHSRKPISVVPNAGIPSMVDGAACYPLSPEALADAHVEFVTEMGVSIVGGCCGTTPEHLRKVVDAVAHLQPAQRAVEFQPSLASLYSAETLAQDTSFLVIGERCNANGSRAYREMLLAEDWDQMVALAKSQTREGAHVLDVCVDYVGRDGVPDMVEVVDRFATQSTLPLVIDSTEPPVIEAALRRLGARAVINSVNLEDGRVKADVLLPLAKRYGAAVIVLAIDEDGQARTADWKVAVCQQVADIAIAEHGLEPSDLIFDALTFPLGSGQEELRRDGIETLEAIRRVKEAIPGCYTVLGVSNASFGLSPAARQVLNSVFLHEAIQHGLDAAIVHPGKILPLHRIPDEHAAVARDLIHDRRGAEGEASTGDDYDPLHRLMELFEGATETRATREELASLPINERLKRRIIDGDRDGIEDDLDGALAAGHAPLAIVNEFLLDGMKVVGELFGSGQMQLPFVLQSAEAMKTAVAYLEPRMEKGEASGKGRVVLATVKGDVHDIGKNLVDIILRNNGYETLNIGIKQPIDAILATAEAEHADAIGMSGLLVKSTVVMRDNLEEMTKRQLDHYPVLLGGAALTRSYVEDDLRSQYDGPLFYCRDAFEGLRVLNEVMEARRAGVELPEELVGRRERPTSRTTRQPTAPPHVDRQGRPKSAVATDVAVPAPPFWGQRVVRGIPIDDVWPLLNEIALFRNQWGFTPGDRTPPEYRAFLDEEARPVLREWVARAKAERLITPEVVYGYYPANSDGDDLIVWDPEGWDGTVGKPPPARELTRFTFPRQTRGRHLCIADFFRDIETGGVDVLGVHLVTVGPRIGEVAAGLFADDRYKDYLYAHGFGVEMAEALAELWHRRVREELGIAGDDGPDKESWFRQDYRGSRYSFGYAACPDLEDQRRLAQLLDFGAVGVRLTDEFMLDPEQSTSAIVVHHPEAKYFNAR